MRPTDARKYPTHCRDVACQVSVLRIDELAPRKHVNRSRFSRVSQPAMMDPCRKMRDSGRLFHDDGRLPRKLEALPATHVLARHHVVLPNHVGAEFGKAGAVAFVGPSRKLALLGTDDPRDLIVGGLMTMWTVQRSGLLFLPLIKKIALFHRVDAPNRGARPIVELLHICMAFS